MKNSLGYEFKDETKYEFVNKIGNTTLSTSYKNKCRATVVMSVLAKMLDGTQLHHR